MTRTRRDLIRAAGVLTVGGLLAGCSGGDGGSDGGDGGDGTTTEPDGGTGTPTPTDGGSSGSPTVAVRSTDEYGDILVDGDGMTLYLFTQDSPDQSVCTGDCAESWPPLTGNEPQAGEGVTAELSTIERSDGSTQVVAGDWPLYYYDPDSEPGDVTGQGVGGVWYVLSPSGEAIRSSGGDGTPTDSPTPMEGPTVQVSSHPDLGEILTDGDGRTLYLFTQDSEGESACTGSCLDNWPPLTGGPPQAGGSVTADLGTIERPDGSTQVTANGMPLYYFAGDSSAGEANGQGVGDVWYVLSPSGDAIRSSGGGGTTDSPTPTPGPTVQASSHPDLGEILTDGDGRTLYMFTQDSEGESACTGSCLDNWPPLTGGPPQAGGSVTADLGTIERPDGSTQVTANGMPLYYFAGDSSAGEANGQGVGDVWYVLRPDGSILQGTGSTSTTTTTSGSGSGSGGGGGGLYG